MKGKRFMNFSTIPCASRGGSISRKHDAMTIAASMAMPPEWLPTSMARPRAGTCSMPRVSTEKYQRYAAARPVSDQRRCCFEMP